MSAKYKNLTSEYAGHLMHLVPALRLKPADHSGDRLRAVTNLLDDDPEYIKVFVEVPEGIEYSPVWEHIGLKYNDDGSTYDVVNVPVPGGYVRCRVIEKVVAHV